MDNRERRSAKKRFTKKRFTVAAILVTAMLLAACTDRNVSKTEETQPPVLTENGHEEEQTAPAKTAESVQDVNQTEQPTGG